MRRNGIPVLYILLLVIMPLSLLAQPKYRIGNNPIKMVINKDTLFSAWAGGLQNPQFSEIDLNGDGVLDLFVFEPSDGKALCFLYDSYGRYFYAPDYESAFPQMNNFALLYDFNHDGKADIFTYSTKGGAIDVYENISEGANIKFRLLYRPLYEDDLSTRLPLYVPSTDIPAIVDVDGDGDVDVLAFDVLQTTVAYYKNIGIEKYGNADTIVLQLQDLCWGKFQLSVSDNNIDLGFSCGKVRKKADEKKQHGGSTMLVTDLDGDGDKDLLIGDIGYTTLFKVENGRKRSGFADLELDSAIAADTLWPQNTVKPNIPYFPAAFEIDVDHDGLKDILISPKQVDESKDAHQIYYYHQAGTVSNPKYEFVEDDFLQNLMFDAGTHSSPAIADLNNDGLPDMIVAVKGNNNIIYQYDKLMLFLNRGTTKQAVFELVESDFLQISQLKEMYLKPCFGDLNGDGKPDLLLGKMDGTLLYYTYIGMKNKKPDFAKSNDDLSNVKSGGLNAPYLFDFDQDGLLDLFCGRRDGSISYYQNIGSKSIPSFNLITDTFGSIQTSVYYYEYVYDDKGNIKDSILRKSPVGASSPAIADLDRDGKPDLVTGSNGTQISFYFDITNGVTEKLVRKDSVFFNDLKGQYENRSFGKVTIPAIGLLDADSFPDLVIGNLRGGLNFVGTVRDITSILQRTKQTALNIKIYPNPAKDFINIELAPNSKNLQIEIFNTMGQSVYAMHTMANHSVQIPVSGFAKGIYFIKLVSKSGENGVKKFVKD